MKGTFTTEDGRVFEGEFTEVKKEEKKEENKNKNKRPRAKVNECYSYMSHNGVLIEKETEKKHQSDNFRYAIGNYATTKKEEKELIKQRDKQLAIMRVKDWIRENLGEFKPDWGDCDQSKNRIVYDYDEENFDSDYDTESQNLPLIGYFKSHDDIEKVIENCEDDLKIIFYIK